MPQGVTSVLINFYGWSITAGNLEVIKNKFKTSTLVCKAKLLDKSEPILNQILLPSFLSPWF